MENKKLKPLLLTDSIRKPIARHQYAIQTTKSVVKNRDELFVFDWWYRVGEDFNKDPCFLAQVPLSTKVVVLKDLPEGFDYTQLFYIKNFMGLILYTEGEEGEIKSNVIRPQYVITSAFHPRIDVSKHFNHYKNGIYQRPKN